MFSRIKGRRRNWNPGYFSERGLGKPAIKVSLIIGLTLIASLGLAAPTAFHIQIEGSSPYYLPKSVEVPVGTPVFWVNPTGTHHTITHDGCKNGESCAFDSGAIAPNGTFGLYRLLPGRYPYHCTLHPIMRGVLTVHDPSMISDT